MKRDRNAVRDVRRMISVNQYDIERINKLLDQSGVEEARLIYRAFKRGLDELEISFCEQTKTRTKTRYPESNRLGQQAGTPALP